MATSDSILATFVHEPLDLSQDSIRLVEVLPIKGSLIHCKITHGLLTNAHVCLSYTWGISVQDETILINGKQFRVRQNLWDFLDVARNKHTNTLFWIDAICIIQDELNPEKAHQVRRMGHIYHNASLVVLWLGKAENEATEKCFDIIQKSETFEQQNLDYIQSMELWKQYTNICNSEYWRRAWIVQELSLATEVVLMVGNQQCDWHAFVRFWKQSAGSEHHTPLAPQIFLSEILKTSVARFIKSIDTDITWKPRPLRALLVEYGLQNCYNPRDRVYSLLSLAEDAEDLVVDYEIDPCELFWKILAVCLKGNCFCFGSRLLSILQVNIIREHMPQTWTPFIPHVSQSSLSENKNVPNRLSNSHVVEFRLENDEILKPSEVRDWNWTYTLPQNPDEEDYVELWSENMDLLEKFDDMPLSWRASKGILCEAGFSLGFWPHRVFLRFGRASPTDTWRCTAIGRPDPRKYDSYISVELGRDSTDITLLERCDIPKIYRSPDRGYYVSFTQAGLLGLLAMIPQHKVCNATARGVFL